MRIDLSTCRDADLLAAEVRRLRGAISALADQDATLSVCEGNVTVTMDATLTVEEREAVAYYIGTGGPDVTDAILGGLLERMRSGALTDTVSQNGDFPTPENKPTQDILAADERAAVEGMASYFDAKGNLTMQAWGSLLHVLLKRIA